MINEVDNTLEIICEDDEIMDKIRTMIFDKDEYNNREFTMRKMLPVPSEFSGQLSDNVKGNYWKRAIWGTKRDVYNCRISDSSDTISISYQTAFSSNKQWVEALCHIIQRMLNYLDAEQPRISVHLSYINFNNRIGGVFDWVPFKAPFSEKYTLLEYARLHDSQLYKALSEFRSHCKPKVCSGQVTMGEGADEFLDEALEEIPF